MGGGPTPSLTSTLPAIHVGSSLAPHYYQYLLAGRCSVYFCLNSSYCYYQTEPWPGQSLSAPTGRGMCPVRQTSAAPNFCAAGGAPCLLTKYSRALVSRRVRLSVLGEWLLSSFCLLSSSCLLSLLLSAHPCTYSLSMHSTFLCLASRMELCALRVAMGGWGTAGRRVDVGGRGHGLLATEHRFFWPRNFLGHFQDGCHPHEVIIIRTPCHRCSPPIQSQIHAP